MDSFKKATINKGKNGGKSSTNEQLIPPFKFCTQFSVQIAKFDHSKKYSIKIEFRNYKVRLNL